MFDIKWIRENPDAFDAGMARRKLPPQAADLIALDAKRRDAQTKAQELQTERNALSKQIGILKSKGEDASGVIAQVSESKAAQAVAEQEVSETAAALMDAMAGLPNIPLDEIPDGDSEDDNVEVRRVGELATFDFDVKDHVEIGENLGMMDFQTAAKIAGSRFVLLSGGLARLERALGAFMLDHNVNEFGYVETNPPALVNDTTMYGTGQLPKFGEDLFKTTDGYWLIPTAEVPLTNIVAEETLDESYLPRRFTAMTWCFRSEAGAAGKDTRGMIRQHQFTKVEMVSVTKPEDSMDELERMTSCAEDILVQLGLPFRTIVLCTGDMGAGARKTYDIEVWLPAQDQYREISSCSVCGEYQARRMNARFKVAGEKGTQFVHTLNGSGLAVGRTLIAVLENYQQADGSVVIPEVLRPYMGGLDVLKADA